MASDPIPGMESIIASVTGYRGADLDNLIRLMTSAGASYVGRLSPSNAFTHLVCWRFEGKKYELGIKMDLIIVNHRWIEDCVKQRQRLPEHPYTVKSGEEVGPLQLKAPVVDVAKPSSSVKKGKAVLDSSNSCQNYGGVTDVGNESSRQGVFADLLLFSEKSFPKSKEKDSSQQRQNKSLKRKELQSSSRDFFEDPPLSRSLRIKESCRRSLRAGRNKTSHKRTSMAEIPRKKRRLVKKVFGSTVLSDSDQQFGETRYHRLENDKVTILSDDSIDELHTGRGPGDVEYEGAEVGGNHSSTSTNPISVVGGPTAPKGSPHNGCLEVEKPEEQLDVRLDSDHLTKSLQRECACIICRTEFSTTRGILPCGHRYCYSCIETWADQLSSRRKIATCPICKAPFTVITKVDDALTSDQNIFSQTIPSAPKVDISSLNGLPTSNFAAQSVSTYGCAECHSWEPEELLISCTVCQFRRIHTYCQDPPSNTWTCLHCKGLRMLYRSYHQY